MSAAADRAPETRSAPAGGEIFSYIDAARGWAIILVMTNHVGISFANQYWPVKKLTNFGWHGVQLFFLCSAVTLLYSWSRSREDFLGKSSKFFLRRFLRIAPLYYFGALFYIIISPPGPEFSFGQLLATLLFVNAWHPDWIPTTPGWMVVPGGWSIGVEFTFYAIFPLLASVVTSLGRASAFLVVSIALAIAANTWGEEIFREVPAMPLKNFLYFWFPNQLPVFAMGAVLFFILRKVEGVSLPPVLSRVCLGLIVLLIFWAAENPAVSDRFVAGQVPQIFIASCLLAVFAFLLAVSGRSIFLHPVIRRIGVLSFSCYVLHFAFVGGFPQWTGGWIDVTASGPRAILMTVILWILVVAATVAMAEVTHRWIEQPGIRLARRLTRRRSTGAAKLA